MRPESSAGSEMGAGSPDNNYQGRDGSIDRDLESGGSSSRAQPSKKQKLDKEGNDQQPQKKKRKQASRPVFSFALISGDANTLTSSCMSLLSAFKGPGC